MKVGRDDAPPALLVPGTPTLYRRDFLTTVLGAASGVVAATFASPTASPYYSAARGSYDLVIYGGTSAAVIAAVQAKRMGKSVVVVCPDRHFGGMSSAGLGWTDTGDKTVIGGLAREFYSRVWRHYSKPESWRSQQPDAYANARLSASRMDNAQRLAWGFEPHVAEAVFESFVRESGFQVFRDEWLNRRNGVKRAGARIVAIKMLSGRTFTGKMFIDATYEGDLMAAAGVDYCVGREARSQYGEDYNGVQINSLQAHIGNHFGSLQQKISPYVIPGDPKSGVLPRVNTNAPGEFGTADKKVQAYCFRMCLTDIPENRVPFPKPAAYDSAQYEMLLRIFATGWRDVLGNSRPLPNRKTDTNNHGPMSTDNIGYNWDYPEASYEKRRSIVREHENYQKGWLYFIANDPRVPTDIQQEIRRWGPARDEFKDNGNWPHQLYIREARRMIGKFVMTENEVMKRRAVPESVGMGSYSMDSHNVQRYITPEGHVQNEGDIGVNPPEPYGIAYGALVPKKSQCENLLVPVCLSATHVAHGSIRMEPVFMILAQAAATVGCLAVDRMQAVQDVSYSRLRERLIADGQVL
jgi:hypothetical protein